MVNAERKDIRSIKILSFSLMFTMYVFLKPICLSNLTNNIFIIGDSQNNALLIFLLR